MKVLAVFLLISLGIAATHSSECKTSPKSKINAEQQYLKNRFKSSLENSKPKIGILVINLGLYAEESETVELLPSAVSLALTAYFTPSPSLITKLKARGHELYFNIPAPNGRVLGEISADVMNEDNFKRWLSPLEKDYQGLAFEQPIDGSPFYIDALVTFLKDKKPKKPITLIFSEVGIRSEMLNVCQENNFRCTISDKVINASDSPAVREKKLSEVLKIAKLSGKAVLSISVKSSKVALELVNWLAKIKKEDQVQIEPLSKLMITPYSGADE